MAFKMKGHALPGINQKTQTSSLKDGRAKSSALQMKSAFLQEEDDKSQLGNNTWSSPELGKQEDKYAGTRQGENQGGVDYGIEQLMLAAKRRKAKKDKEENPSEVLDEKINEYSVTGDAEDNSNPEFQSPVGGQTGPYPETDQDGDGILDSEQVDVMKDNNPNDGINAPDYMINKSGKDMSNEVLQESHDNKVQNLINKAKSGNSTSEGSSAFMDIKKIYPEKSNEEITAMIERGTI